MAAAKKNPFRGFKDASYGAVGTVAFTVGGTDIDAPFVTGGIEVDADCTLVLVLEHDGLDVEGVTFGTAAGVAYPLVKGRHPLRVKKIVQAGSTGGATGRFLL